MIDIKKDLSFIINKTKFLKQIMSGDVKCIILYCVKQYCVFGEEGKFLHFFLFILTIVYTMYLPGIMICYFIVHISLIKIYNHFDLICVIIV